MRIQVIPLDFLGNGALLEPRHPKLFQMAVDYIAANMAQSFEPCRLAKCWVAAEVDMNGEPIAVHGITGYVLRPDVPVFRVTGEYSDRVTVALRERLNDYLADQGWRGGEAFLYISDKEKPEQRCDKWEQSLAAAGAVPAERYIVKVR